jgi:hypothetical protein
VDAVLQQTLVDAASMLEARGIPFAVIGGLAVSFRGQPRMTIDVDLVIQADVDATLQLVKTLEDTPFAPLFADVEQVVTTAFILPLRHRRTGVRLDVAIGMSGFEQDAVRRATTVDVGGAAWRWPMRSALPSMSTSPPACGLPDPLADGVCRPRWRTGLADRCFAAATDFRGIAHTVW